MRQCFTFFPLFYGFLKKKIFQFLKMMSENSQRYPPHLEEIHRNDWKLFMWFASLKKYDNYVYLFIVVWDAISIDPKNDSVDNVAERSKEFNEEIGLMKNYS